MNHPSGRSAMNANACAFLTGLSIGASIAILFAPKPGKETVEDLKSLASQGRDVLNKRKEEVVGKANEIIEKGKEAVTTQRERMSAALEAGKRAYQEKGDRASATM